MNTVTGNKFNLLKYRAINLYGAKDLEYSNRMNKKFTEFLELPSVVVNMFKRTMSTYLKIKYIEIIYG